MTKPRKNTKCLHIIIHNIIFTTIIEQTTYRVIQSAGPAQMDRINRRDTRRRRRNRIYQTPRRHRRSCVYLSCTKIYNFFLYSLVH